MSFLKISKIALRWAIFLFKTTFLYFQYEMNILESMMVNNVKFRPARIQAYPFGSVTTSQRLLWVTLSHDLPKAESEICLKIYVSTFVLASGSLLTEVSINVFIYAFGQIGRLYEHLWFLKVSSAYPHPLPKKYYMDSVSPYISVCLCTGKQDPLPSHEVLLVFQHQFWKTIFAVHSPQQWKFQETWITRIVQLFIIPTLQRVVRRCWRTKGAHI